MDKLNIGQIPYEKRPKKIFDFLKTTEEAPQYFKSFLNKYDDIASLRKAVTNNKEATSHIVKQLFIWLNYNITDFVEFDTYTEGADDTVRKIKGCNNNTLTQGLLKAKWRLINIDKGLIDNIVNSIPHNSQSALLQWDTESIQSLSNWESEALQALGTWPIENLRNFVKLSSKQIKLLGECITDDIEAIGTWPWPGIERIIDFEIATSGFSIPKMTNDQQREEFQKALKQIGDDVGLFIIIDTARGKVQMYSVDKDGSDLIR